MSTVKQKLRRGELKLFNIIESKMLINCVTTFLVGKIKNISVFFFRKHTNNASKFCLLIGRDLISGSSDT